MQVESLQDFAVDFRVNGQEVMPHLRRWTADSLRFTNVTDQTSEGRTSDAEFCHDARVVAAARSRRGGVPLSRQSLCRVTACCPSMEYGIVGGAVRAGVLEPPRDASVVRISAEPVRVRLQMTRSGSAGA